MRLEDMIPFCAAIGLMCSAQQSTPLTEIAAPLRAAVVDVCPPAWGAVCERVSVDVASFQTALSPAEVAVTTEALSQAMGMTVSDVPSRDAYRCAQGQPLHECMPTAPRTHLSVTSVPTTDGSLVLEVLQTWAGRAEPPTRGGFSIIRYRYVKRGSAWVYEGRELQVMT
jgi:hypothetical protein